MRVRTEHRKSENSLAGVRDAIAGLLISAPPSLKWLWLRVHGSRPPPPAFRQYVPA